MFLHLCDLERFHKNSRMVHILFVSLAFLPVIFFKKKSGPKLFPFANRISAFAPRLVVHRRKIW